VRRLLVVVMAIGAILLPANTAWARGGGWQPVEYPPELMFNCGSAPVTATLPVNMQYYRTTTLPDGTVLTQYTGALTITFTAESGVSVTHNISGPAKVFNYTNGDVEVQYTGVNGGPPPIPGLPDLIWTAGLVHIIYHPDGSFTVIHFPHVVTDICQELGL
jgi:hypothetical protein